MRDAITALEAALAELANAREGLPEDLTKELDAIIAQARNVIRSLEGSATTEDAVTEGSGRADAPG